MSSIPAIDAQKNINSSPHVVILGAGASLASFPDGEKHGRKIPLMADIVSIIGLESIIQKYDVNYDGRNFEEFFHCLAKEKRHDALRKEIELAISDYFSFLELSDETTLYDYLILSLRNKDVIATFNWDPFLAQAYQRNGAAIGYENLPSILFLHGSVSIGLCRKCKTKGWLYDTCNQCGKLLEPSKLLYPVGNKNYSSDDFLSSEWSTIQNFIQQSYLITIFGYSAPATDIEAKKLLLEVWKNNSLRDFAQIDVIDIQPERDIKDNWKEFIVRENFSVHNRLFDSYLLLHPRRTCDAFAMATLQQRPWKDNPLPTQLSLVELQEWVSPLVQEETEGNFSGEPC